MPIVNHGVILSVEDDAVSRICIQHILKRADYTVISTTCVKTALEALAKHHIDLAIIDLYMPEKDGLELIELIRVGKAKGCVSGLPIILHSAALTSCKAADELLAKFCPKPHFLSKPINAQDLLHWVKELLVRH